MFFVALAVLLLGLGLVLGLRAGASARGSGYCKRHACTTSTAPSTTTVPTTTTQPTTTTDPASCVEPTNPLSDRLFSCASAWNQPIPPGTPYHPGDATMRQGLTDAETVNGTRYPIFYMNWPDTRTDYPSANTPLVTVKLDSTTSCDQAEYQIPITGTVLPFGVGESHFEVMQPDGTEWDLYEASAPSQTPNDHEPPVCPDDNSWHAHQISKHVPGVNSGGWSGLGYCTGGVPYANGCFYWRASHTSGAAEIRLRDMQIPYSPTATWDHAVAFKLPNISIRSSNPWGVPFVPPANQSDGNCGSRGVGSLPASECLPMGARVQLDPSLDCNTWPSLQGKPQWMFVLCRTLQVYGGIIEDTSGGGMSNDDSRGQFVGLLGFTASVTDPPSDLDSHLHVIDWNVWAGA